MFRAALSALFFLLPAAAQESPPDEAQHQVRLRSGTLLVGRLEPREWKATTPFGPLAVPIADLRRIRFGRKADPDRLERVRKLLEDLGSPNPERKAAAQVSLAEEGDFALPDIKEAAALSADPEVKRRCEELLGTQDPQEMELPSDDDRVETVRFTFTGTVNEEAIRVQVPELGPVTVRRKDVQEIRSWKPAAALRFELSGSHTYVGEWLDTQLAVHPGMTLRIRADGTINFPQWGNYTFRPDGMINMGQIENLPLGTLVGRVGKNGQMFRVGSSYMGMPSARGNLYLAILVQVQGQQTSGTYRIRIETEE
ncbi:MAG: hypothetical protein ACT4PV_09700 [Planctomycetaceae bacterium]